MVAQGFAERSTVALIVRAPASHVLIRGRKLRRHNRCLAHGGVLGPAMRFRFPAYARTLQAPEGRLTFHEGFTAAL